MASIKIFSLFFVTINVALITLPQGLQGLGSHRAFTPQFPCLDHKGCSPESLDKDVCSGQEYAYPCCAQIVTDQNEFSGCSCCLKSCDSYPTENDCVGLCMGYDEIETPDSTHVESSISDPDPEALTAGCSTRFFHQN